MSNAVIAFVGSGNLTQALISGLLSNQFDPQKIWAADPDLEKLQALSQRFGVKTTQNNLEAIRQADVVLLAVKPMHLQTLCTEIKSLVLQRRPLVISVAAGATIALLEKWLGSYATIVRAMPNTPGDGRGRRYGFVCGFRSNHCAERFSRSHFPRRRYDSMGCR